MDGDEVNKKLKDVQFMIDATFAIVDKDYKRAVELLYEGVEKGIESKKIINTTDFLTALYLLIGTVEKSLSKDFGIELRPQTKSDNL